MSESARNADGTSRIRSKAKTDLRVLKTQRAIREAFMQLLAEKPFESITVQNIIDRALVNRKTFYNHFRDKYDLAEQVMTGIGNDLRQIAEQAKAMGGANHLQETYAALQGYRTEVLALWDVKTDREESLSNLLTGILSDMYLDRTQTRPQGEPSQGPESPHDAQTDSSRQLQARLYATVATASLKFFLESNGRFSVSDIHRAIAAIVQTALKDNER